MSERTRVANMQSRVGIVIIRDESESLEEPWGPNATVTLAEGVVVAINKTLMELILRCASGPQIRGRAEVAMIGYSDNEVRSILPGKLRGKRWVTVSELNAAAAASNGQVPSFVEPVAFSNTCTYEAIVEAASLVDDFISRYPDGPAPIVLHISDGEHNTRDPFDAITKLTNRRTSVGPVSFWHIHVSPRYEEAVLFPSSLDELPDDPYARALFEVCSTLSPELVEVARRQEMRLGESPRGFGYNCDLDSLVKALITGTTIRR